MTEPTEETVGGGQIDPVPDSVPIPQNISLNTSSWGSTAGSTPPTINIVSEPMSPPPIVLDMDATIVVADDQGVTDVPETATMHANPYEAAKAIRYSVRALGKEVMAYMPPTPTANGDTIGNVKYALESLQMFGREEDNYLDRLGAHKNQLQELIPALRAAVESRRAVEGREALREVNRKIDEIDVGIQRVYGRRRRVREFTDSAVTFAGQAQAPATHLGDQAKEHIHKLCEELHLLAQAIPTFPNAPMAPADNVLRAVATMLKNGGYLDSSSEYVKVLAGEDPTIAEEEELEEDDNAEE